MLERLVLLYIAWFIRSSFWLFFLESIDFSRSSFLGDDPF